MNISRHLYLSTALRSPDDPAAPEPEVVIAAEVQPEAEVVAEVQPEPAAAAIEPEPAPVHGNRGQTPWFMREIPKLREEKQEERTGRLAAEQRAKDLEAIIERMQANPTAVPPPGPAVRQPAKQPDDFSAAVKAQAAHDRFIEDTLGVRQAGITKFPDFLESLRILEAVGVTSSDDFVADVLAVDKGTAHEIFDKLAKDPEKAASLVGMDSRRRIAELTRMADAPKPEPKPAVAEAPKPAAPAISRAPAPKPAVSPLAAAPDVDPTTPDGNDKMDDKAWEAWYKAKYMKRA